MARFEIETEIHASREVCFDLARNIDFHLVSFSASGEKAVAGRVEGLIELGEEVTWRARHFGMTHLHTSRITEYDRPTHFRDSMTEGRFARFDHDHYFEDKDRSTIMRDVVDFAWPLGLLGRVANQLFLNRYLKKIITTHGINIKREAERKFSALRS